jgi:hypothetical protein
MAPCYAFLMIFNLSLLCVYEADFWCHFVVCLWCFSTPPYCAFLVSLPPCWSCTFLIDLLVLFVVFLLYVIGVIPQVKISLNRCHKWVSMWTWRGCKVCSFNLTWSLRIGNCSTIPKFQIFWNVMEDLIKKGGFHS